MTSSMKFPNGATVTHVIKTNSKIPLYSYPEGGGFSPLDDEESLEKDLAMHASYHELKKMYLVYVNKKARFVLEKDVEVIEKVKNSPLKALQLLGFFVDKEKKIRLWRWNPSADIDTYSLAKFLPFVMTSGGVNAISEEEVQDACATWQLHFEISEIPEGAKNSKEYQEVRRKVDSGVYG
jgi:hypothetical protein